MTSTDNYTLRCGDCGTRNRIPAAKIGVPARCGRCGGQIDTRVLGNGRPKLVNDANFEAEVIHSPLPVLAFFWAPWCPTCVKTAPIIERLAGEARGRLRIAKINVDKANRSRTAMTSAPSPTSTSSTTVGPWPTCPAAWTRRN